MRSLLAKTQFNKVNNLLQNTLIALFGIFGDLKKVGVGYKAKRSHSGTVTIIMVAGRLPQLE